MLRFRTWGQNQQVKFDRVIKLAIDAAVTAAIDVATKIAGKVAIDAES